MLLLVNKHLYRYFYLLLSLVDNALVNKMFRIHVIISSFYYVFYYGLIRPEYCIILLSCSALLCILFICIFFLYIIIIVWGALPLLF